MAKDLSKEYPDHVEGAVFEVDADHPVSKKIEQLKHLRATLEGLEEKKVKLENEIKEFMKTAESIVDEDENELVTWRTAVSMRFDTTGFKKVHPEMYEEFTKPSKARRFLVK